jgi:branched-chain amino acid aminotransferase
MNISIEKSKTPKQKPDENKLGFGKYFTDHIFVSDFNRQKGWHSPRIIPYQNLFLDPGASVLHYGQALFEGLKAFRQIDGKIAIFRPEFNWSRMLEGSKRLCMECPQKDLFIEGIRELVKMDQDWVPRDEKSSLYIRPTLIGSEAFLGVRPSDEFLFFVILSPVGSYYGEGSDRVKIWVEENYTRACPGGLGATKAAANYASSLKAALEAKQKGFAQVLWLDANKEYVEEVGTMNVFFVLKNEIITPMLDGTILSGGTREVVLELLNKNQSLNGKKVNVKKISLKEIEQAYEAGELLEAFGTGTAAVISPISELTNNRMKIKLDGENTISNQLQKEIFEIQRGKIKDTRNWLLNV